MTFVTNWREVLRHAWSIRLILLAALLSGLEAVLPFLGWIPHGPLAILSFFVISGAFIARLVAQSTISGDGE